MLSQDQQPALDIQANKPVRIIIPFKDQRSDDLVRRQLSHFAKKINSDLQPVFTSKKIADEIKHLTLNLTPLKQNFVFDSSRAPRLEFYSILSFLS